MARHGLIAVLSALALLPSGVTPWAAEITSAYTDLDLADCREQPTDPDDPLQSGVWWCEGYAGIPVYVTEVDLRFIVSYGPTATEEIAASETLPAFNTLGDTIEWRLAPGLDGRPLPFATILRFHTDADGIKGQVLVITKLATPGQVCRVGTIDVSHNPDANALAREVADNAAPGFACGHDQPLAYGLVGDDARP